MRYSYTSLVLATFAAGQAFAASIGHAHSAIHENHAIRHAEHLKMEAKRDSLMTRDATSTLETLGCMSGANAVSTSSNAWIGSTGAYTNELINDSGESLVLVIWGPAGSWVNVNQPLITISLAAGASETVSFASGASGAWSAVYSDTTMVNGQISNTWGEYTFGEYGVVDVSREVNMSGHTMSIVGPSCTTDMNTCVFVCPSGNVCTTGYELLNCENGSQTGANYGTYDGSPSGGCGGMGSSAALKTYLS